MDANTQKIHVVRRGEPKKLPVGREYTGIEYKLRFQTNRGIFLHGLGFAGLSPSSSSNEFRATLSAKESLYNDNTKTGGWEIFMERMTFIKEGVKGEEFTVKLPTPVKLPPYMLFDVGIQLDPLSNADTAKVHFDELGNGPGTSGGAITHSAGVEFSFSNSTNAVTEIYFSK